MIKQILRDAYWRRRHEKNDILLQTRYFQTHVCPPPAFYTVQNRQFLWSAHYWLYRLRIFSFSGTDSNGSGFILILFKNHNNECTCSCLKRRNISLTLRKGYILSGFTLHIKIVIFKNYKIY